MSWATYEGLSLPECVRCCGGPSCTIECVSKEFTGSPVLEELHSVIDDINFEWDVTMEVVGVSFITSGTIERPTSPGEGTLSVYIVEGSPVYLATKTTTGSPPWDMDGTEIISYTFDQIYAIIIGNIHPSGTPPDGGYLIQTVVGSAKTWGVSSAATDGTECSAFFNNDGGGVYSVTWVNARLRLDNLDIGQTYLASMDVYEDGVFLETIETIFTAENTTEYTPYTDLLQSYATSADGTVYSVEACSIEVYEDPCAEYTECFDEEVATGPGYDDGYAAGYADGYGVGFICDPFDPPSPPSTFNCPPDTTCEEGTAAGYTQAYNFGYEDGYTDGYPEGFSDGGCT